MIVLNADRFFTQGREALEHGIAHGDGENDGRGVGEVFQELEPEDLLKFGLIPEFVGRLPVIATLTDLDEDALVTILTQPKNALVKQYQRLFEMEDAGLEFTDDAMKEIVKLALERKVGARALRSVMESLMLNLMYDLPETKKENDAFVITADMVAGRTDATLATARKKGKKSKKESA